MENNSPTTPSSSEKTTPQETPKGAKVSDATNIANTQTSAEPSISRGTTKPQSPAQTPPKQPPQKPAPKAQSSKQIFTSVRPTSFSSQPNLVPHTPSTPSIDLVSAAASESPITMKTGSFSGKQPRKLSSKTTALLFILLILCLAGIYYYLTSVQGIDFSAKINSFIQNFISSNE